MKPFIFCFMALLMAMAATTTLAGPLPSSSGPLEVPSDVEVDDITAEENKDTAEVTNQDKRVKRENNDYDSMLVFICPSRQSISTISSYHHNGYEDRRFSLNCKNVFDQNPQCSQPSWVNNFDAPFDFICPRNAVLTGIFSEHSNPHEDRRFMFQCCSANLRLQGCHWTPYLNGFDQPFNYHVPNHMVIAGMSSYHHNGAEDRRYRFYVCNN